MALNRLEQVRGFFEEGGATPGTGKRWKYRRMLGYGGNGIVSHFRIYESQPERYQDVAVKVQLRGWQSQPLRDERDLMRVRAFYSVYPCRFCLPSPAPPPVTIFLPSFPFALSKGKETVTPDPSSAYQVTRR